MKTVQNIQLVLNSVSTVEHRVLDTRTFWRFFEYSKFRVIVSSNRALNFLLNFFINTFSLIFFHLFCRKVGKHLFEKLMNIKLILIKKCFSRVNIFNV
jgi:hypothetical protein